MSIPVTVDEPPPGTRIILRAVVGSTAHGTHMPGSDDRDEMAIGIEPRDYVIGLRQWETTQQRSQPEGVRSGPGDLDLTIHSLRKYARLCARGNPTMLLPLFVTGDWLLHWDDIGYRLRAARSIFLSKLCGAAFSGYMCAQRQRLAGVQGSRHGKPRTELIEQYGFDTKYAGHIIRLGLQGIELLTHGIITLPMKPEERERVRAVRQGQVPLHEVLQQAEAMERQLYVLTQATHLPESPDWDAINDLLIWSYKTAWLLKEVKK